MGYARQARLPASDLRENGRHDQTASGSVYCPHDVISEEERACPQGVFYACGAFDSHGDDYALVSRIRGKATRR